MTKVLIVDDDPVLLRLLSRLIGRRGHEVMSFTSGFEALAAAEKHPIDLMVLDVEMPGMGGVETMQRLQALQPCVPVILLSCYSALIGHVHVLSPTRCAVLTKELAPTALLALVDSMTSECVRPVSKEKRSQCYASETAPMYRGQFQTQKG